MTLSQNYFSNLIVGFFLTITEKNYHIENCGYSSPVNNKLSAGDIIYQTMTQILTGKKTYLRFRHSGVNYSNEWINTVSIFGFLLLINLTILQNEVIKAVCQNPVLLFGIISVTWTCALFGPFHYQSNYKLFSEEKNG